MIRFGTDGVRGHAGTAPITAEGAVRIGRAAARLAREEGGDRVLLARATRPSGAMLVAAAAAGVAAEGGTALLADVLPTAGLMAALADGIADAGVMVTASHNPAKDNGFKVMGANGRKLSDALSSRFEAWIQEDPQPGDPGVLEPIGLQARRCYHRALDDAAPGATALEGLKIAVDLAHGAATSTARWLKERYPGTTWHLRGTGDGVINEGVGSEHPAGLVDLVLEQGCHAGIAVDGDADRCLLVDERGEIVHGDALAWLLASTMEVRSLAVTVMSTTALEAALPDVRVERTPVGDRHLMLAMQQHGIPLGCEESGHVLFADGLPGGDGILTGLRALASARLRERPLSEALAPFVPFPRVKTKVRVSARPPLDELPELLDAIALGESKLGPGRVFVRYSGTEPVLRILVEGPDASVVEDVAFDVTEVARQVLP